MPLIQMSFDEMTGAVGSQRWRNGRSCFVPPDTRFNPSRAEAVLLPEAEAKAFVTAHHYSHSFPAARCRVGLTVKPSPFAQEQLAGVAVFSVPMQPATIPRYLGVAPAEGVELGRLVLLDDDGSGTVGFNAESWFLARAMRLLRRILPEVKGIVSYADPVPRYAPTGEIVKPGHAGICYRASNADFHGRSRGRTLIVSRTGQVVNERMLSKIRLEESGIDYACRRLHELGAPERQPHESGAGYLSRALADGGFSTMRHPGNFVFTWSWGGRR